MTQKILSNYGFVLYCMNWSGLVWSGLVWSGLVWSGLVWPVVACPNLGPYYSRNYGPYAIAGRLKKPVLYQPESERQKPEDSR